MIEIIFKLESRYQVLLKSFENKVDYFESPLFNDKFKAGLNPAKSACIFNLKIFNYQ